MRGRVLVFCEGVWLAHTARPLVIARALREAGWQVEFGASGAFTRLVTDEGFKAHGLATMNPSSALESIRSLRIEYDRKLIESYIDDELTVIKRVRPDFVLNDFRLPAAISARVAGVRLVNIVNAYMTHYYAPVRRAPRDLGVARFLPRRASTAILPYIMRLMLRLYVRPFNAAAEARGLAPFGDLFDVIASPDLNLVCDLEEFMPITGAPRHFKEIGPIIWEPNVASPEWLRTIDPGRPTVYFTMGSTGFAHYYRVLKEAFEGTDFQVLVTTGGVTDPGELPANFSVAKLAPALRILEKSSLVICHGGNGTIYQALSKGVPVLGIPTFHDQDFNMQRVEDLGLGAALSPEGLTGEVLRETAESLIADDGIKAAAVRMGEVIRATDAAKTALKYIDELLK